MPEQEIRRRNRNRDRVMEPPPPPDHPDFDNSEFIPRRYARCDFHSQQHLLKSAFCGFIRCLAYFSLVSVISLVIFYCISDYEISIVRNHNVNTIKEQSNRIFENLSENDQETEDNEISNSQNEISSLRERVEQLDKLLKCTEARIIAKLTAESSKTEEIIDRRVEKAIMTYDADKIGIFDYAAEYAGAIVEFTPDTQPYPIHQNKELLGIFAIEKLSQAVAVIQSGSLPGECFAFYGAEGFITIKLAKKIIITHVTLEHVSHLLEQDQSSAPKDFEVFASNDITTHPGTSLGQFSYKTHTADSRQTFKVDKAADKAFGYVLLHILNNHGNEEYTCVYRFRAHSIQSKSTLLKTDHYK